MRTFLLSFIWLLSAQLIGQTITFDRVYEPTAYHDIRDMVPCADGGTVFTGLAKGAPDTLGDMFLTKVNAAGAVLWSHKYGRDKEDGGNALLATRDGGYLITGHTALSYGDECDGYLVKTDAQGKEQWRSFVGTAYDDVCNASLELEDGTFIAVGRVEEPSTHTFSILFAHLDAQGLQLQFSALPLPFSAIGFRVARASDGHILIAGYSNTNYVPAADMLVVKCKTTGEVIWQRSWGTPLHDRAYDLVPDAHGGCTVVGGSMHSDGSVAQMLAMHLDTNAEITKTRTDWPQNTGFGCLYQAKRLDNDHFVAVGVAQEAANQPQKLALCVVNYNLEMVQIRTTDTEQSYRPRCVAMSHDGAILSGGNLLDEHGMFLSKWVLDQSAATTPLAQMEQHLVFPNPFAEQIYFRIAGLEAGAQLTLYNASGKQVREAQIAIDEVVLDRLYLDAGTYYYMVRSAQGALHTSGSVVVK